MSTSNKPATHRPTTHTPESGDSKKSRDLAEQKLQQKYVELQIIDARLKQVQKQLQQVDSQALELLRLVEGLAELKEFNARKEILVPFSSGIFLKASIELPEDLLVSVGSSVVVKKSIEETKALVESQVAELERIKIQLMDDLNAAVIKAQSIEGELIQISEQIKN